MKSKILKLSGPIMDLQISKDLKFYYVAFKGGTIKKIQTGGKNLEISSFTGHTDDINTIEISPDGNYLASASNDKTIIIWDLNSGKIYKTLSGFEWKVTSLKYSSDGKYIIGGCNDGVAKIFDIATAKAVTELKDMGKNVRDVSISRDGSTAIIATHMDAQKFGAVLYNTGIITTPLPETGTDGKVKKTVPTADAGKAKTTKGTIKK
jgi:WD40 repeat protein